jgi:hypothetical protein
MAFVELEIPNRHQDAVTRLRAELRPDTRRITRMNRDSVGDHRQLTFRNSKVECELASRSVRDHHRSRRAAHRPPQGHSASQSFAHGKATMHGEHVRQSEYSRRGRSVNRHRKLVTVHHVYTMTTKQTQKVANTARIDWSVQVIDLG